MLTWLGGHPWALLKDGKRRFLEAWVVFWEVHWEVPWAVLWEVFWKGEGGGSGQGANVVKKASVGFTRRE